MRTALLVIIGTVFPMVCHGQAADSVRWRNKCRSAAQIIRTGHPNPHEAWAYPQIQTCGPEAGRVLAERLRALRVSSDTSELKRVTSVSGFRDRRVYDAAMEIASDRAASAAARAYAFRNLLWYVSEVADPALFDPWNPAGLGCNGSAMDREIFTGEPLPEGYVQEIRALAARVVRDTSELAPVRYGARCVLAFSGS